MGGGLLIRAAGPQTGTAVSGPRAQPSGRGVAAADLVGTEPHLLRREPVQFSPDSHVKRRLAVREPRREVDGGAVQRRAAWPRPRGATRPSPPNLSSQWPPRAPGARCARR
eukprot:8742038-Alexandrium_andersonii.AAC.1